MSDPSARSRRALLSASVGGLVGLMATRLGRPDAVHAANNDPLTLGTTNAATATTTLTVTGLAGVPAVTVSNNNGFALYGSSAIGSGVGGNGGDYPGVLGTSLTQAGVQGTGSPGIYGSGATGVKGSGEAVGVEGIGAVGIRGWSSGQTGVQGQAGGAPGDTTPPDATGVFGSGATGVFGSGTQGVHGHSPTGKGVQGTSTSATGVFGYSGSGPVPSGGANTGVYGVSNVSTSARGVTGSSSAGVGVRAVSSSGVAIYGTSTTGRALLASSGSAASAALAHSTSSKTGVHGFSGPGSAPANPTIPTGIFGDAAGTDATGVWGTSASTTGTGVYGESAIGVWGYGGWGVFGSSTTTGTGVYGVATDGAVPAAPVNTGVFGYSTTGIGVQAQGGSAGTALNVVGKATFSRSGKISVASGATSYKKTVAGLTSASLVFAEFNTSETGVYVRAVVPASGYFTVYFNKALPSSATVGWIAFN